jgi:CHAT domain-containing protein
MLSACDTARGTTVAGDGVLGLRRAFLLAGAEALVTTQWSVEERAGAVFTVALYEGLRAGMRSADAVTNAMRVVRRDNPHPFAWAPFVLVGRDDVMDWGTQTRAATAMGATVEGRP